MGVPTVRSARQRGCPMGSEQGRAEGWLILRWPVSAPGELPPHSTSPKAAEAARLLLSDMWSSRELQGSPFHDAFSACYTEQCTCPLTLAEEEVGRDTSNYKAWSDLLTVPPF